MTMGGEGLLYKEMRVNNLRFEINKRRRVSFVRQ